MQSPILILGASGGVGSDIARTLDQAGNARLILHGRNRAALQTLASRMGSQPRLLTGDLTDANGVSMLFDEVRREFGRLEAVIFSIAVPFRYRLAHNTAWEEFAAQLDSQLRILHLCATAALPLLTNPEAATRFIVVSSEVAMMPLAKTAAYACAKAAMTTYAQVIAKEWIKKNVRVHIVAPGLMRTGMTGHLPEEFLSQLEETMPERRLTTTSDVAGAVAFLLTDAANAMYGQPLLISRGAR